MQPGAHLQAAIPNRWRCLSTPRGIFAAAMEGKAYPVMEQFYTLQGEGYHTGRAAYFIRLGGCDVGCFWCDVKESWDAAVHPKFAVGDLLERIRQSGADRVVITGGEPMMHNCTSLTESIAAEGIHVHLETAGVHPISGKWDWICLSPKKFKPTLPEYYAKAHELKVIVYNRHDLSWAEGHAAQVGPDCRLYLQPEWDQREEVLPMLLNYIRDEPRWTLSQQTHKYLGIP